jgi:hypothetical protein
MIYDIRKGESGNKECFLQIKEDIKIGKYVYRCICIYLFINMSVCVCMYVYVYMIYDIKKGESENKECLLQIKEDVKTGFLYTCI